MPMLPSGLAGPLFSALNRLELSLDPKLTISRVRHHHFSWRSDGQYLFFLVLALTNLLYLRLHPLLKLLLVAAFSTGLLVPLSSQILFPGIPVFAWLLLFISCPDIPLAVRPHIWVSVLPTLETVLFGANISDVLTQSTSTLLDILAWLPYGVGHFCGPVICALLIWIFGPPGAVKFFAKVFGYMNTSAVLTQIVFPCAPPWYEILHGLSPANYSMPGSPGGLARIDALFHSSGYTAAFTASPVVFGAFPSLHAGWATMEALTLGHFFPKARTAYWIYVAWLYWSTMYLTHHYLVDLVAGGGLAASIFYFFMEDEFRHPYQTTRPSVYRTVSTDPEAIPKDVPMVDGTDLTEEERLTEHLLSRHSRDDSKESNNSIA